MAFLVSARRSFRAYPVVAALLIGAPGLTGPGPFAASRLEAQAQATRGALTGVVRSGPARVGLPYAVVSIPSLGIERFTMLKYGLSSMRPLYENDVRFLRQFA